MWERKKTLHPSIVSTYIQKASVGPRSVSRPTLCKSCLLCFKTATQPYIKYVQTWTWTQLASSSLHRSAGQTKGNSWKIGLTCEWAWEFSFLSQYSYCDCLLVLFRRSRLELAWESDRIHPFIGLFFYSFFFLNDHKICKCRCKSMHNLYQAIYGLTSLLAGHHCLS